MAYWLHALPELYFQKVRKVSTRHPSLIPPVPPPSCCSSLWPPTHGGWRWVCVEWDAEQAPVRVSLTSSRIVGGGVGRCQVGLFLPLRMCDFGGNLTHLQGSWWRDLCLFHRDFFFFFKLPSDLFPKALVPQFLSLLFQPSPALWPSSYLWTLNSLVHGSLGGPQAACVRAASFCTPPACSAAPPAPSSPAPASQVRESAHVQFVSLSCRRRSRGSSSTSACTWST